MDAKKLHLSIVTSQHLMFSDLFIWASQVAQAVKNPPANAGDPRHWFDPWMGKISWRRK